MVMFRRFCFSPRYAVIAVAVTVALILRCDLAAAQTTPPASPSPSPTASGTSATPTPSASSTTGMTTADDDEPGGGSLDCNTDFVGDSQCDDENNSEVCGYDGGDCCSCTCVSSDNNCGGNFNCIDPEATCVNDDDGDGGTLVVNDDDTAADAEEDSEGVEANESDSASGLFTSATSFRVAVATLAAIGLVAVVP